jgi:hypothetical protein
MGHHHSLQSPLQFLPHFLQHRMKENKQMKSWAIKNKKPWFTLFEEVIVTIPSL